MAKMIGRRIGAYVIKSQIGGGGNSDVYLAEDTANGNRLVALKVLRLEHNADPDKVKRFWNGGHAARALQHDHIVPIYDAGLADSHYYIAMKYMAGKSMDDLLHENGGPVAPELTVHYLDQIAGAIDFAHQRGIIHRDIKPSNILLSKDRRHAYLADFGIAKLTGQTTKTEFGTLIGTPEYMSPEQIQGHTIDARSDIYSLGVTAYHMLAGQLPFDGVAATVLYNHVNTPPPAIRRANGRLAAALNRPIARSMAKRPGSRYDSAAAFVSDLRQALRPASPGPSRRVIGVALFLVAAAVALLALFRPGIGDPPTTVIVTVNVTATPNVGGIVGPAVTSTVAPPADPTSTARPETSVAPTNRPIITPTTTGGTATPVPPTPTAPVTGQVVLLSPANGADIPGGDGRGQVFSWEFDRPLAGDESFELRFFPEGGGAYLAPFGWHTPSRVSDIDLNNLPHGSYNWVVAVVKGTDGIWEADVTVSPSFRLTWGR